jgi:hypothetical protein
MRSSRPGRRVARSLYQGAALAAARDASAFCRTTSVPVAIGYDPAAVPSQDSGWRPSSDAVAFAASRPGNRSERPEKLGRAREESLRNFRVLSEPDRRFSARSRGRARSQRGGPFWPGAHTMTCPQLSCAPGGWFGSHEGKQQLPA